METTRLEKIRKPSRVEKLLEVLVTRANLVPQGAYQLRDRGGLPSAMQQVLAQSMSTDRVWTCWTDSSRIWLFTAEMSLALSRGCGAPVLRLNVYSERGEPEDAGDWMVDPEGSWRRCAD